MRRQKWAHEESGKYITEVYTAWLKKQSNSVERKKANSSTRFEKFCRRAGISICINDMKIPLSKEDFVEKAEKEVFDVEQQYSDGLITDGEKYNKIVDIWSKATDKITQQMMEEMSVEYAPDSAGTVQDLKSFNSVYIMA